MKGVLFEKRNFEELIERHGWDIIWYKAYKCGCINTTTNQPDYKCSLCNGTGYVYRIQTDFNVYKEKVIYVNENTIKLRCSYAWKYRDDKKIKSIKRIYKYDGTPLSINTINDDNTITLNETITSFDTIFADYVFSILEEKEKTIENVYNYNGKGYFELDIDEWIYNIISVKDEFDNDLIVDRFNYNGVLLQNYVDRVIIKYNRIIPMKWLITSVVRTKYFKQFGELEMGDLMATFSGDLEVNDMDKIYILNNVLEQNEFVFNTSDNFKKDIIINAEVIKELEVYDENNNPITNYNRVFNKIIFDGVDDKIYTIRYKYIPVYKVFLKLPQVRNHDEQVLPKRVFLRKDDYFEKKSEVLF